MQWYCSEWFVSDLQGVDVDTVSSLISLSLALIYLHP